MKNEHVHRLPTNFNIQINFVHQQKKLSLETLAHIEELWKNEIIRTKGKVFNGQLLSADDFDGIVLKGHFVEYKHYLAQARDPTLRDQLQIKPICVSGYTSAQEEILFGRRSEHVTDYQGFLELVPSGGIDSLAVKQDGIDIHKQFQIELLEEAGIEASLILHITPIFLIRCTEVCSYEICAKIELEPSCRELLVERDEEYKELIWVPRTALQEFVEKHRSHIVPLSLQILDLFEKNSS